MDGPARNGSADDALRRSEARYRALVEAASQAVWTWSPEKANGDFEGTIRWWENLTGQTAEEQKRSHASWLDVVHPDDRPAATAAWGAAIATGVPYDAEYRVRGREGGWRYIRARGIPVRSSDGAVVEWVGTLADVTDPRLADDARRVSEGRFRALMEQAPFSVQIFAPDGRTLGVNRAWEELWGLTLDQLADYNLLTDPQLEAKGVAPYLRRAAAGEAVEIPAIRYDPEETIPGRSRSTDPPRWVSAVAYPLRDPHGRVREVVLVHQDITERVQAADQLGRVTEESDRRKRLYETILSSTPDFVYVFSLDHRVLYANKALIEMWGHSPEDTIGKTFLEIGYEPWHAEMHAREIDTVRATRRPIRGEVPFTGTNGRRIYDYIFVPVLGADGEVEAVAGTTRDVTDRKAMEDELREADQKKDEFIALLAHELRNPLAPIRNGLQVLRLGAGNPDALVRARDMMDRQLTHMVRLIDDLLDISRINRNKMELRRERVTLADVVASAVETARPALDAAGHELTVSLPATPVVLDADLTRLAQVFSNLLTNSAKYTPTGGRVWLSAERADGRVVIAVRDTGIGIPAESLPTIFDMFSQVDRSVEKSAGGLGIGLALVKGLVEMHGGTVTAASDGDGQGTTFTVTLPEAERPEAPEPAASAAPAHGPGRRILVVDDNRDGAESMSDMLGLLGHEVRTAFDGVEAVEVAETFRPDVILMDVGMPRMNGLDATRRIRERPWGKQIAIVALTGWGQENDRERSREAGCDAHLVKPVDLADLQRVLSEVAK